MKEPTNCVLWNNPETVREWNMKDGFERLDIYLNTSHHWRYLLKCRECGQLYFWEFYEEVDWISGEDPQFSTYVPVQTNADIENLKNTSRLELLNFAPRLNIDFPRGAKKPKVYWTRD
jgi:hypothetical protein